MFFESELSKTRFKIITFYQNKKGEGVMGRDTFSGKIAFLSKKAKAQPQPREKWLCQIAGENAAKTVLFVEPVCKWPEGEVTFEHLRNAGCKEVLTESFTGLLVVKFYLDGIEVGTFSALDIPEYAEQCKQKERAAIAAIEEAGAGRVYWKDVQNLPVEKIAYSTSEYKLEVLYDEDWGLHKADPGSTILVWPVPTQELFTAEQAVEEAWGIVRERYGLDVSWLDVVEGGEDEGGCQGPNTGLVKLVWDEVARRFVKTTVTVGIPAETVEEIKKQGEEPCKVVLRTLTGYARKSGV